MTRSMIRLVRTVALVGFLGACSAVLPAAPAVESAAIQENFCEEACTDAYNSCVESCTTLKCAALCDRRFAMCVGRCN